MEQIPTSHMGAAAAQMERRGIATEKGSVNRRIAADYQLLKEVRGRLSRLKQWFDNVAQPEHWEGTGQPGAVPRQIITGTG